MSEKRGPWTIRGSDLRYENPWVSVREYDVVRPDGADGRYGVVSPKNLAIAILPIDAEGFSYLVGQHRFPLDRYSWEIPEGGVPMDEDPLTGAQRELSEETGLVAGSWTEILHMDLSNSITDEVSIGYLATALTQAGEPQPDPTEVLKQRRIHFLDLLDEVATGQIRDAITVAIVFKAYYMAREKKLDTALASAMLTRP